MLIILSILAALALPKLFDISSTANKAVLQNLAVEIKSASELAHVRFLMTPGSGLTTGMGLSVKGPNNISGWMFNGYPTAKSRTPTWFGIEDWVDLSAFTRYELGDGNSRVEYRIKRSRDPAHCKITYNEAVNPNTRPAIIMDDAGC